MTSIYAVPNRGAAWHRPLLALVFLSVLFLVSGCRSERQSVLPPPDLDVLVTTPTPMTVRVEVVVMVVSPTPEPTTEAPAAASDGDSAAAAPATAQNASMGSDELVSMGEDLYTRNCASCHQNNGEGTDTYPALNNSAALTAEDPTQSIQLVLYGRGEMPAFEDTLSTQQIAAVLSYERNAWSNNAALVTVEQVRQVRQGGSAVAATQVSAAPAEQAEAAPTEQAETTPAEQAEAAPTEQPTTAPAEPVEATPTEQVAAAQAEPAEADAQALIEQGNTVYATECASCHQLSGEGTSSYPALSNSPLLIAEDPTAAIQVVLYGRGEMPAFEGLLSNQEIAAVLSHERNAWDNSASIVTVAQVEQVQQGGEAAGDSQDGAQSASATTTVTATNTVIVTATETPTATITVTPASTVAATATESMTATATISPTQPDVETEAADAAPTATASAIATGSITATTSVTATPTFTTAAGAAQTATPPLTWTPERAVTPLLPATTEPITRSVTPTATGMITGTPTTAVTPTQRVTTTVGATFTATVPLTWTPDRAVTPLLPAAAGPITSSVTPTATGMITGTPTPQATGTPVDGTPTLTTTLTATLTLTAETTTVTPTPSAAAGGSGASGNGAEALIAQGEEVYATECASCHQLSGEGSSQYPALRNAELLTADDPSEAIQIVLHGRGEMPAFADLLSDEEIAAVLSFERNSWGNSAPTVSTEEVAAVRSSATSGATENE